MTFEFLYIAIILGLISYDIYQGFRAAAGRRPQAVPIRADYLYPVRSRHTEEDMPSGAGKALMFK